MSDPKIYELENSMAAEEAVVQRRKIIGFDGCLSTETYKGIENAIGKLGYPVGIAGPVDGCYVPLATTESALVASVNRGFKFVSGADIDIEIVDNGITRAPAFRFASEDDALTFVEFIQSSYDEIKSRFDTKHLSLVDLQILQGETDVYLRFVADSSDAMGMNMTTIKVDEVVRDYVLGDSPVQVIDWVLSSNYCCDKKVSMMNIESGRGYKVDVKCRIKNPGLDLERCRNIYEMKYKRGSALAGCVTSNGHVSNMIAALFLAFGQDLGHVPDSSQANFELEIDGDDLVFSLSMYNLIIGVVGGGTDLDYVQDFLQFCNIYSKEDLAKLFAKTCLAGEISLFISLVEGTLAESHDRLRNKK